MNNYVISIGRLSQKFISKQPQKQKERILKAIYNLPSGDIKKLTNRNEYRLRVGEYRIIYELNDKQLTILVTNIGNRGDVYK